MMRTKGNRRTQGQIPITVLLSCWRYMVLIFFPIILWQSWYLVLHLKVVQGTTAGDSAICWHYDIIQHHGSWVSGYSPKQDTHLNKRKIILLLCVTSYLYDTLGHLDVCKDMDVICRIRYILSKYFWVVIWGYVLNNIFKKLRSVSL